MSSFIELVVCWIVWGNDGSNLDSVWMIIYLLIAFFLQSDFLSILELNEISITHLIQLCNFPKVREPLSLVLVSILKDWLLFVPCSGLHPNLLPERTNIQQFDSFGFKGRDKEQTRSEYQRTTRKNNRSC